MRRKIGGVAFIIALFSCSVDGTNWDLEAIAPVVETKLDLTNLIGEDNLSIDPDSAINVAVDVPLYTFSFDTLSSLPSGVTVYSYVWPYPTVTLPSGGSLPPDTSFLDLNSNEIKLSRIDMKKGKLKCTLKSSVNRRLIFNYSIPKATKNGVPLAFVDTLPAAAAPGDTVIFVKELILDDYHFDLSGGAGDDFNSLAATIKASTVPGDPPLTITNNATLFKAETQLVEITPNYAKGYLGHYDFNGVNSTTNLDALEMVRSGLIDVENVNLNLIFHNTIGADVGFKPIEIKATNTRTGMQVILTHSSIGTNININRATQTLSVLNPVSESSYSFSINSGNSNIEQFLELIPDQLSLMADVQLNQYGNTGGYTDFFYYDFPTYIQMQLNMPLKFSATNLLLIDTIDNPFTGLDILDPITDGEFIVRVENKFPLESDLQLYLLDAAGTMTDSLFASTLVAAAPVNAFDRVTQPVTTDLTIQATAINIQNLKAANKIKLKANFNTAPASSGRLQFYSDYYMLIRMIADIKFNIAL